MGSCGSMKCPIAYVVGSWLLLWRHHEAAAINLGQALSTGIVERACSCCFPWTCTCWKDSRWVFLWPCHETTGAASGNPEHCLCGSATRQQVSSHCCRKSSALTVWLGHDYAQLRAELGRAAAGQGDKDPCLFHGYAMRQQGA